MNRREIKPRQGGNHDRSSQDRKNAAVEGRIERIGAGQIFRSARGAALPLDPARKFPDGLESIYGVRPEHLSIAHGDAGVLANIHVVEPTGSETQVTMDVEGDVLVGVFRERIGSASGPALRIMPDTGKIHLFDKGTGQRVAGAGQTKPP